MNPAYIGRFAPSPTGPLHFGSLIAALVSYLHARKLGGQWRVRIEDLDPPREMPGASTLILKQLERHGLTWDGEVLYQSNRHVRYQEVIQQLLVNGSAYYCRCSRRDVEAMGGVYDGRCRLARTSDPDDAAVRIQVPDEDKITYTDLFQGEQVSFPARDGDYVIRRRDGFYAYQLAVVVDDIDQGITHIIRGMDLQEATPRQLWLSKHLHATPPEFGHIPVATNKFQQKLSKQNHADSLDRLPPAENLQMALSWLGIPTIDNGPSPSELLNHALQHWNPATINGLHSRPAPKEYQ